MATDKDKIGHVSLKEHEPGRWLIRYRDPHTGKDVRMRLNAGTFPEAVADAEAHNRYCRGEVDTPPHLQRKKKQVALSLTIEQAFKQSECELNCGNGSLARFRCDAARFTEYANGEGITRWNQVGRDLIRRYYRDMNESGLAFDTIRMNLIPLRVASRYWALESDNFTDEYTLARIKHRRPDGWEPEIQFLTLKQVHGLLTWLKENAAPRFHAMAMIGFYTGARQLEIANLRPCDINTKARILTFTDTETHDVKTALSKRTVPVPQCVLDAITEWPVDDKAPLFLTVGGSPYDANKLAREWRRFVLQPGRADDDLDLPEWFTAKKMRPTFATLAGESGVDEVHLQKMMGHAPANVMRRFYRSISAKGLEKQVAKYWQKLSVKRSKSHKINAFN